MPTVIAVVAVVLLTGAQRSCETARSNSSAVANDVKVVASDAQGDAARVSVEVNGGSGGSGGGGGGSVQYTVSSDARVKSITYIGTDGGTVKQSNVSGSWIGAGPDHGRVMVRATLGSDGTWISCSIKTGGTTIQQARSSGSGSVTVVCAGSH